MPKSLLVTGAAGFIGSHLVDRLLASGAAVTGLDNFNDFYNPAIKDANCRAHLNHPDYRLVRGDIRNAADVSRCFEGASYDAVVHLAAMAGVRPSIRQPYLYQDVNLAGTMTVLEAVRNHQVGRLVFASSSSVYGDNEKVPFAETDPVERPISPYAATKRAGELLAYAFHHLFGIKTAALRFFTVYGPRQRPEMGIATFIRNLHAGIPIDLYGDGSTARDYTYIDDIVDGIMGVLGSEYDFEIINLGRSDVVTLTELIAKLERIMNRRAVVNRHPQQPGDVRRTWADISKAGALFGYSPRVSIDEGLQRFVTWFEQQQGN